MGKNKKRLFRYLVNATPGITTLDTTVFFETTFYESGGSAIDKFFHKEEEINKLISPSISSDNFNILAGLTLLGAVSAVESYFREIIRRIINIDKKSKEQCEKQTLTFGAASTHTKEMLPDAVLEQYSFASQKNIIKAFKELLGIHEGDFSHELKDVLSQFSKICQFRHCIVHRYGRLGTDNAISLGLEEHKNCVEKPIKMNYKLLQDVILVCHSTVKVINNYLFEHILNRLIFEGPSPWAWDFRKDKKLFSDYFSIFSSSINPPDPKPEIKDAYENYKKIAKSNANVP